MLSLWDVRCIFMDTLCQHTMKLTSKCLGVHTTTTGAVSLCETDIVVPQNCSLYKWSTTSPGINLPTPHTSFITFVCHSKTYKYYASCDWKGVIAIYDDNFEVFFSLKGLDPPLAAVKFHGDDVLMVLTRGKHEHDPTSIATYQVQNNNVSLTKVLSGNYYQCASFDNFIFSWNWLQPEFTLCVHDSELGVLIKQQKLMSDSPGIGFAINKENLILEVNNRSLLWFNTTTLLEHSSSHLINVASSKIWTMILISQYNLLFQKSRQTYVILDIRTGDVVKSFCGPSAFACYIEISPSNPKYLWVCTVESMACLIFTQPLDQPDPSTTTELPVSSKVYNFHEISCCGLILHGAHLITGDMAGNIFTWDATSEGQQITRHSSEGIISGGHEPPSENPITYLSKTHIQDGIRALACHTTSEGRDVVLIGTLSGMLLFWTIETDTEPVPFVGAGDTITCIRTSGDNLVCYSSITGEVFVEEVDYEMLMETWGTSGHTNILSRTIHIPRTPATPEEEAKFGSLRLQAEVWSVDVSPCQQYVLSGSEDQTTKITEISSGNVMKSFKDHELAVTCVRWVVVATGTMLSLRDNAPLAVSSSDDNMIIVRDPWQGVILRKYSLPEELHGFCTLTYFDLLLPTSSDELSPGFGKCRVVMGTVNGYVIVRDLETGEVEFCERVHQGSIEGLWGRTGGSFATCSSDCTVQVHWLEADEGKLRS